MVNSGCLINTLLPHGLTAMCHQRRQSVARDACYVKMSTVELS